MSLFPVDIELMERNRDANKSLQKTQEYGLALDNLTSIETEPMLIRTAIKSIVLAILYLSNFLFIA